ncbi:diiron oxygenase [Streptomyces sp. TRM49041]|uniref:diiron oxygenase n=1 Tax=Streptomyces sp. TRM49041 TaxID=2603216 RepID=UPI0011EC57B0|nr:diiron oxygenase [Streptomyces sp. TRM49041]
MPLFNAARLDMVRYQNGQNQLHTGVKSVAADSYRSRFGRWEERASVRAKPQRVLEGGGEHCLYFPPEFVPVATHPLVAERGQECVERILVHRLFHYLHFTVDLEQVAVIPISSQISRGRAGLHLPERMKEDAFKISTDEAWHAQFTYDMLKQVERQTGVPAHMPELPQFIERLDRVHRHMDPDLRGIDELIFAVVSETLISNMLADLPRDERLPKAVRELVADHAEDEGKHHAYFSSLLEYVWPALSRDQQRRIGPWIPELIFSFLEPDYRAMSYGLHESGFRASEIDQIVHESYPREVVAETIREAALATIHYFRGVGVLDDPATRDAFLAAGLIDQV